LLPGIKLDPVKWHDVEMTWDTKSGQCQVLLNGQSAGALQANRRSDGLNYLRLRSTSTEPEGGLMIEFVKADVSESWPNDLAGSSVR
jgi:hypothetical protein